MTSAGCTRAADIALENVVVSDSAGMTIVQNMVGPEDVTSWQPGAPRLLLGEVLGPPDLQLHKVVAATKDSRGRILVGDAGNYSIKVYSAAGEFLFAVGSQGNGPGELQALASLMTDSRDRIMAFDPRASRLVVWSSEGEHERTVRVGALEGGSFSSVRSNEGGGAIGIRSQIEIADNQPLVLGLYRSDALAVYLDSALQPRDTIAVFPGMERFYYPKESYSHVRLTYPLMAARPVAAVDGSCVHAMTGRGFSITTFCKERVIPLRRVDWELAPLSLDEAAFAAHGSATFERRTGLTLAEDRFLREYPMDMPPARPAAGEMLVGADGSIWVAEYFEVDEPAANWWVFDRNGKLVLRATFPRAYRVLWIGSSELIVVERDALDVERIAVYALPSALVAREQTTL